MSTRLRVAIFLAYRQIKRANIWTTTLIVSIMTLTFLNLVVISGILVGLIVGINNEFRKTFNGDVFISTLDKKNEIENTTEILSALKSFPEIASYSVRYTRGGTIESGYKTKKLDEEPNKIGATIAGIDPVMEDQFGGLGSKIMDGRYLTKTDSDSVLLGDILLEEYNSSSGLPTLKKTRVGDKIRIKIGESEKEYKIVGVIKAKADQVALRVYMNASEFRKFTNLQNQNASEISIDLKDQAFDTTLQSALLGNGFGSGAKIQTHDEATPKFVKDIQNTFAMLGNAIGSIGIIVASITLFIVIFINAVTRRKFIGILKGIGIDERSIEYSYVLQSIFYAVVGSAIGLLITYGFLVPFFEANPIDFPFSNGILVAPVVDTSFRVLVLVMTTIVAGYIPAKLIVRQNTLNAILGR